MASIRNSMKSLGQRAIFAAERFGRDELANHAAAGAYAFLLSATPAVLLVIGIGTAMLRAAPDALASFMGFITAMLEPLDAEGAAEAFFSRPLGGLAAIVGGLSLVWAARLFIVTVQRGIRIIWAAEKRHAVLLENVLTFAFEIICLVAAVAVLAGAQAAQLVVGRAGASMGGASRAFTSALASLAPALVLFLFVYISYRYIPAQRLGRGFAALFALLCVAGYAAASWIIGLAVDTGRYAQLYGLFANLILLLVNVYLFFSLFYFFAELAYVEERFDALLLGRFRRVRSKAARGGTIPRLEAALFFEPERLMKAYGRAYEANETVIEAGSKGKETYIVHRGQVGAFAPGGARVGIIGPGEIFGEMAAFLDEGRSATIRALEDSYVLAIPPGVFMSYLKTDPEANRHLVAALSARLKDANARIGADGE